MIIGKIQQKKGLGRSIAPDELPRLAPRLKPYLRRPDRPTWPELVDAAGDWLRPALGVSQSLWADACLAMGRELAAVALAIVSTKDPDHFTNLPAEYFRGMVAKHIAGELHLYRMVWALRHAISYHPSTAGDPERHADRTRDLNGKSPRSS